MGLAAALVFVLGGATPAFTQSRQAGRGGQSHESGDDPKLDGKLNDRERTVKGGTSRVIIQLKPGWDLSNDSNAKDDGDTSNEVRRQGGKVGRRLSVINGMVVELPNRVLRRLAHHPAVERIVWDRPLDSKMNRVAITVGARAVQARYGYTGAGIGVAVIDSGVTSWHNDLTYQGTSSLVQTLNGQRVAAFVDFVAGRTSPYDDFGHGTHVAGIIAGNGYDASRSRAGIAPDAHLVSLKVLDADGRGVISNVIAALDWAITNRAAYNIRVINLSVGAAVTESYDTDPLAQAAKRAVDAGIVVVAAAGNLGKNSLGEPQYGAITAPGNSPWVLTVGAYSTQGTVTRKDDVMALYSSRGPTAIDYLAKPDLVAPGTGVVSLSEPTSLMYSTKSEYLLDGTQLEATKPYLSLSGTSMAAPVVAGTVALMLQANPNMTPNLVKAVLQYTSQNYPGYDPLTQGTGFINTKAAVDLARFYVTAKPGQHFPRPFMWSRNIHWGNHLLSGGVIKPSATAWQLGVTWGAAKDLSANNIVWGTLCGNSCNNVLWTSQDRVASLLGATNIVWGTATLDATNIVWGTVFTASNIVWGTVTASNIVWGTDCGGFDCDHVAWGTEITAANIVWGTGLTPANIVWGTALRGFNIVWGTGGDVAPVVWATTESGGMWGSSGTDTTMFDDPIAPPVVLDAPAVFDDLFGLGVLGPVAVPPPAAPVAAPTTPVLKPLGVL
jgi:serine protease AprX